MSNNTNNFLIYKINETRLYMQFLNDFVISCTLIDITEETHWKIWAVKFPQVSKIVRNLQELRPLNNLFLHFPLPRQALKAPSMHPNMWFVGSSSFLFLVTGSQTSSSTTNKILQNWYRKISWNNFWFFPISENLEKHFFHCSLPVRMIRCDSLEALRSTTSVFIKREFYI